MRCEPRSMDFQVEVLKTDLPREADTLRCNVEALGSGEVVTTTSNLVEAGSPKLSFHLKKASTHVALLFTTLCGSKEVGSCLYPMTFNNRMTRLLGSLCPSELSKQTHLAYLSTKIQGLGIEKVVGRIWFKIKDLKMDKKGHLPESGGTWTNIQSVQNDLSPPPPSKPSIAELLSRESSIACTSPVPSEGATISVLFHSVTTLKPKLVPKDILTIACIGSVPDIREDTLFNEGGGPLHTLATLKPTMLKCTDGTMLEFHMANVNDNSLFFSASCPLAEMLPFKQYNWEYNWRWLPGITGFSPAHSRGNLEANVTLSVVHWPSLSDYPEYEGLEVFVEGVEFDSKHENTDLVLCCRVTSAEENKKAALLRTISIPPYRQQQGEGEAPFDGFHNFNMAVIQYSPSTESRPVKVPGYFFFSSQPNFASSRSGHQIVLTLYATSHNADLWWHTLSTSTATIDLPESLRHSLPMPGNQDGVKWELTGEAITNTIKDALAVKKISGILRWKGNGTKFLSCNTLSRISELPLLSDVEKSVQDSPHVYSSAQQVPLAGHDAMWKEAVAKIGNDILKLREENAHLTKENRDYEKYILDMEASIIVTVTNQKTLLPLSREDLIHKIVKLSECLNMETQTRVDFQSKIRTLQNSLIKKNDTELHYIELQEAHTAQQRLVRELQAKVAKYKKCLDTCKQQETVINKLESLLAQETKDCTGNAQESLNTLSQENARLRTQLSRCQGDEADSISTERDKTVESLKSELRRTKKKCQELSERVSHLSEHTVDIGERYKVEGLERKLEVATIREKAVMEELKNSVVQWAKEKARDELEIAQLKRSNSQPLNSAGTGNEIQPTAPHNTITTPTSSQQGNNSIITSPRSIQTQDSIPTPLPTAQCRSSSSLSNSN